MKIKKKQALLQCLFFLTQFIDAHDAVKLISTDQSICVMPCDAFVEKTTQEVNWVANAQNSMLHLACYPLIK